MSAIKEFLSQCENASEINFVGPLANKYCVSGITVFVDSSPELKKNAFWIGDRDTSDPGDLVNVLKILPCDKDRSDFAEALAVLPDAIKKVLAHGFLGGRKDHEFFNYFEAVQWVKKGVMREVHFDSQIIVFGPGTFNLTLHSLFSCLAIDGLPFSIKGKLKYPIAEGLRPLSSHGLSNQAYGEIELNIASALILWIS